MTLISTMSRVQCFTTILPIHSRGTYLAVQSREVIIISESDTVTSMRSEYAEFFQFAPGCKNVQQVTDTDKRSMVLKEKACLISGKIF